MFYHSMLNKNGNCYRYISVLTKAFIGLMGVYMSTSGNDDTKFYWINKLYKAKRHIKLCKHHWLAHNGQ